MRYSIRFLCHDKSENNLNHQCNDYEQAQHFFWAMVMELKSNHDTYQWELTLWSHLLNASAETLVQFPEGKMALMHFSKNNKEIKMNSHTNIILRIELNELITQVDAMKLAESIKDRIEEIDAEADRNYIHYIFIEKIYRS